MPDCSDWCICHPRSSNIHCKSLTVNVACTEIARNLSTLSHYQDNSCRMGMCENLRFLHGWLVTESSMIWYYYSLKFRSRQKPCRNQALPKEVFGWGQKSWGQASHLVMCDFHMGTFALFSCLLEYTHTNYFEWNAHMQGKIRLEQQVVPLYRELFIQVCLHGPTCVEFYLYQASSLFIGPTDPLLGRSL